MSAAVVTAVFVPAEGKRAELTDALRATMPAVHGEEGCLLYAIHDASDGTITMIEKWTSAQALDAHSQGDPVAALTPRQREVLQLLAEGRAAKEIAAQDEVLAGKAVDAPAIVEFLHRVVDEVAFDVRALSPVRDR